MECKVSLPDGTIINGGAFGLRLCDGFAVLSISDMLVSTHMAMYLISFFLSVSSSKFAALTSVNISTTLSVFVIR